MGLSFYTDVLKNNLLKVRHYERKIQFVIDSMIEQYKGMDNK